MWGMGRGKGGFDWEAGERVEEVGSATCVLA